MNGVAMAELTDPVEMMRACLIDTGLTRYAPLVSHNGWSFHLPGLRDLAPSAGDLDLLYRAAALCNMRLKGRTYPSICRACGGTNATKTCQTTLDLLMGRLCEKWNPDGTPAR